MRYELERRGDRCGRGRGVLAAGASVLLLTGCAGAGKPARTASVAVPETWSGAASTAPAPAPADVDASLVSWWTRLGDATLTSLVERALVSSVDVRKSAARVRQARARRGLAGSELLPSVTLSNTQSRNRTSEETGTGSTRDLYSAGLDATWEVDLFGGKRRGVEAAEADLEATAASLDDVKASLAAEVALAYVDLRLQEARYAIAAKNLSSQSETLELTRLRNRAGLANGLDVARAESRVAETSALIPAYVEARENAANRLDLLLGLAPGALREELGAGGDVPRVPATASAGIPSEALRRRPDVRAAERRLAAETSRTAQAEAALHPAFTLGARVGLESSSLSSLLDARALTASFVRGLTAPIFDRRNIRRQIEIQDAVAEQALADYETTILSALSETENAFLALDGSRARQAALDSGVASARAAADLARMSWSAGLSDLDSVLDAERSLLALEESLARSRADEISAFVRLSKALGGGPAPSAPARTDERRNG